MSRISRTDMVVANIHQRYKENGSEGNTINNSINTLAEIDPDFRDPAVRNAVRSQLSRDLRPGGKLHYLVEKKMIRPGLEDRAMWANGIEKTTTTVPVTIESRAFAPLRAIDSENIKALPDTYAQQYHSLLDLNLTGRKGEVVATYGVVSVTQYRAALDKIAMLQDEVKFLRNLLNKNPPSLAAE